MLREDEEKKKSASLLPLRANFFSTILAILSLITVGMRFVALRSDPYPALSWSSALLTDEGFYLHDARNTLLFKTFHPDEFHNALIMPLLSWVQVHVFSAVGIGFLQTRLISVFCSLISICFLYAGLQKFAGRRAALLAITLYGLDHVPLLYSRMGLMDTPALLPMTAAFWAFARGCASWRQEENGKSSFFLFLCGLCLIVSYAVRGLSMSLFPAPFVALFCLSPSDNKTPRQFIFALLTGMIVGIAVYVTLWALPNHAELSRVNHFYLTHQLLPSSPFALLKNLSNALFGVERGMFPFLLRHSPILTLGTVVILVSLLSSLRNSSRKTLCPELVFLIVWVLCGWLLCGMISYSPSRYYVLFFPPMAALCGLFLSGEIANFKHIAIFDFWTKALVGLGTFHGVLIVMRSSASIAFWIAACSAVLVLIFTRRWTSASRISPTRKVRIRVFALWFAINSSWLLHWGFTLGNTQQDAIHWLKSNLPTDAVLYGDIASGLSPDLPFRTVPVVPGLCNEGLPVIVPHAPRYLLILDEPYLPRFWIKQYPAIISPENRLKNFPKIVKLPAVLSRISVK